MRKKTKVILLCITALVLTGVSFYLLPIGYLFYTMASQMRAGQSYMNSITEKDIPIWTDRTKMYLKEYDPNSKIIGVYGIPDKPVPEELKKLKILRIDISQDSVTYVWVGGFDHTYLHVQRTEQGDFRFIAIYNDYSSKVIWPKQETADIGLE